MSNIIYATAADIADIYSLMQSAHTSLEKKDWYVTDDVDFLERHIEAEGYILKYVMDDRLAAFLVVRHPGTADDNLGRELFTQGVLMQKETSSGRLEESTGRTVGAVISVDILRTGGIQLDKVAHMESAAVASAYRGRGLQGKLLQKAEEIERARGSKYLMATVHPENVYSLRNLLKAGYECILETDKYGGLPRKVLCKSL